VALKKYIIAVDDLGFATTVTFDRTRPSICNGSWTDTCAGVTDYSNGDIRVDPSRLTVVPAGPTYARNAPRYSLLTYGILVYNQALAPAYNIIISDPVGKGTAGGIPPYQIYNPQANWADTGATFPGTFAYDSNGLTFTAASNTPLPATTNGTYESSSAFLITFDVLIDAQGPGCSVKNPAILTQYAAVEGGVNQGR
jgi:hypothetical protein